MTTEELDDIFWECNRLLRKAKEFENVLPKEQIQLLNALTERQAEELQKESGVEKYNFKNILFLCAFRSYLHTQYLYTGRLAPSHVDYNELVEKFTANYNYIIELFLPPKLDNLLSKVVKGVFTEIGLIENTTIKKIFASDEFKEHIMLRLETSAFLGSVLWQTTESFMRKELNLKISRPKVFISYSTKDEKKVNNIERKLNKSGIDTWRDRKDIRIGEPILDRINEGILKECDFVLIILSINSIDSNWCKTEIRIAYQKEIENNEIFLLPILIDACKVPAELKVKKYLDISSKSSQKLEELVKNIATYHSLRKQI